jgi:hypothetical protein
MAAFFVSISYTLGFLMLYLPSQILKWSGSKHDGMRYNQFCYDFDASGSGAPSRQAAINMTFKGIGLISGLFFIVFKMWTSNQHCPEIWYYVRYMNTYVLAALIAGFSLF